MSAGTLWFCTRCWFCIFGCVWTFWLKPDSWLWAICGSKFRLVFFTLAKMLDCAVLLSIFCDWLFANAACWFRLLSARLFWVLVFSKEVSAKFLDERLFSTDVFVSVGEFTWILLFSSALLFFTDTEFSEFSWASADIWADKSPCTIVLLENKSVWTGVFSSFLTSFFVFLGLKGSPGAMYKWPESRPSSFK